MLNINVWKKWNTEEGPDAELIIKAVAILIYLITGYVAAQYLGAALFFLLNKRLPIGITWDAFSAYWTIYADDPKRLKYLQIAAALSYGAVYGLPIWAIILHRKKQEERSLHGDARFATSKEIKKAKLKGKGGIIIGKHEGTYLNFQGQQFVLVAAPSRTGKGVGVVIPNLLNYDHSVVVLDIKLENFRETSGFRKEIGQLVFLFNPFSEEGKSHRWNPLGSISKNPHLRAGDILTIGQALYPSDNVKNSFWNDQARNLFLGLVLYLIETPSLPCTLGEVLRQASGNGMPIKDYLKGLMTARQNDDKHPLSSACVDALNRFCSGSDETASNILSTLLAPLTIFTNPIVDAATSHCDFDISRVRKDRMSIYLGVPPGKLEDARLLMNLFFSQLISINTKELPKDNPELKYPCLLVLDEFPALGKIGILAKAVGYISGYNLRLLPIMQSLSQLDSVYGENDARTFLSNHALQVIFTPDEQRDAKHYSEKLGTYTVKSTVETQSRPRGIFMSGNQPGSEGENITEQKRPLMMAQELRELGERREIIFKENCKPILCEKVIYYEEDVFQKRLLSPAPVPTMEVDLHQSKIEQRLRKITVAELEPLPTHQLEMIAKDLPVLDDPQDPSDASVSQLVQFYLSKITIQPTPKNNQPNLSKGTSS